jgi:hypothetical protein
MNTQPSLPFSGEGSAFGYGIAVEEAALLSELGEPYARYMRRTSRLIPVWFRNTSLS